jgi:diguanylate cyclase (GGDEF)-like protein
MMKDLDSIDTAHGMILLRAAEKAHPAFSVCLGFVLIGAIGLLDYLTGYEVSFSMFYFVPLALVAWKGGRWLGIIAAFTCTAAWFGVNGVANKAFSSSFAVYGNVSTHFLSLALLSILLSLLTEWIARLHASSRSDPLTGVANSRAFLETLKMEIARARRYERPLTLAYLDLDNFKSVNDILGHATGDKVLQTMVSTVNANIRVTDVLGRLGGDEFALLLPETDMQGARTVVDRIRSEIEREMALREWPVTLSVGSQTSLGARICADELIKRADGLMYEAKSKGKNCASFSSVPSELSA